MRNPQRTRYSKHLFFFLFFFVTSFFSLRTLKKVNIKDIEIYGSDFFKKEVIIKNSSVDFPKGLIFINPKFMEKELKRNLSLENILISRQIIPFRLKIRIKTRTPIAYGEKTISGKETKGFIDKDGFFIDYKYADIRDPKGLSLEVIGWKKKFRKILSKIIKSQQDDEIEFSKIIFSPDGFLTLVEKDLNIILLGLNSNFIDYQLQIIKNLKYQFKTNNIPKKIDNIDLTDPIKPTIKVFKP